MTDNDYSYEALVNDGDPDEVVKWLVAMTLKHNTTDDPDARDEMIAWIDENGSDIYAVLAAAIYPNLEGIVTSPDFAALEAEVLNHFRVGKQFTKWIKK